MKVFLKALRSSEIPIDFPKVVKGVISSGPTAKGNKQETITRKTLKYCELNVTLSSRRTHWKITFHVHGESLG